MAQFQTFRAACDDFCNEAMAEERPEEVDGYAAAFAAGAMAMGVAVLEICMAEDGSKAQIQAKCVAWLEEAMVALVERLAKYRGRRPDIRAESN